MTIDQLIEQLGTKKYAKIEARAAHTVALADLRAKEAQGETVDVTVVDTHRAAKAAIDAEMAQIDTRIAALQVEARADEAVEALTREVVPTGTRMPAYDQVARIGQEARTYNPDADKRGGTFLRDVAGAFFGDGQARDRLNRHMIEEERDGRVVERAVGTGGFAGLTVPQYLTDMYAPLARAVRPFADLCNHHDLPAAGMTINISRITTGSSTALQASQNTGVSETNMADTLLTENVQTISGQQTLSRQALERSTGVENVMLDDLFRSYHTTLDSTLIVQATTGLDAVSTAAANIAYTTGSPTAATLWPKLLDGRQRIESALLSTQFDETVAVMHARRWAWLQSQVGPNWPFIAQNVNNDLVMTGGLDQGLTYGSGYRGIVAGIHVVVDNNITTNNGAGTNEDRVYIVNRHEMHLWEDPNAPMLIRAEQPAVASLGVLFVVYGYSAYTLRRYPAASAAITGTGLVTPVF